MQFYTPTNTAQHIIAASMREPCADHVAAALSQGAMRQPNGAYRFPDGSAMTLTVSGLPVEYVGA